MPNLKLSWTNIGFLREQIEVAEEGNKLGHEGTIITDCEYTVSWDSNYVTLELPEEE